ncbi:MAG TPA: serine protease [Elusimicrobiales bacterium]|nr:serine protease [Elusimicrobiales bacterium]
MKNLLKATAGTALILSLPLLSFAKSKSIYGADNRLDYYEAAAGLQTLSDSVVSLWRSGDVTANAATKMSDLTTSTLGDDNYLCPNERFADQATGAFCSGTLVGEDLIMTAGHCVKTEAACADTKFIFGFKVGAKDETGPKAVASGEVYGCASIVKRYKAGEAGSPFPAGQTLGADYALVKLDRKVTGHKPLAINRSGSIKKDTGIFVIGHPSGMPLKVAGDATVRDAGKKGYFVANLDTFGGNSGSAVFNAATNKIEGILVRGANDYTATPAGCYTVATFEMTGGRGEDVTLISELSALIPRLPGEKAEEAAAPEYQSVDSSSLQLSSPVAMPIFIGF